MPAPEFIPPTPFPTRAFVAIGAVWVVLDLLALAVPFIMPVLGWNSNFLAYALLASIWPPLISAKVMLMLGWLFLGEGSMARRLAGLVLFAPIVLAIVLVWLIAAMPLAPGNMEMLAAFCIGLGCTLIIAIPTSYVIGLPFLLLRFGEFRLVRGSFPVEQSRRQFTIRQLMFITLLAAVVMGLLRWSRESGIVLGLLFPLLAWFYPFAATMGLLQLRWYPGVAYVIGMWLYLVALPLCTLATADAINTLVFVALYTTFIAGHLLLLRRLGFRIVPDTTGLSRQYRANSDVVFLNGIAIRPATQWAGTEESVADATDSPPGESPG